MHGITCSSYYSNIEIDQILKNSGYNVITVKKILYKMGFSKKELDERGWETAYTKKYVWRTTEEWDILSSKVLEWWKSDKYGNWYTYTPVADSDNQYNHIYHWDWERSPVEKRETAQTLWMMERNNVFRRLIINKLKEIEL